MNNHNTTATSLPNAATANKVIVNMTGSSSPAQINMISSSLQKTAFQAAPTTTKPTNPTLIPINITVPASTPITLVPTNQVTSTSGINSPSSSYGGFAHCSNCGDYGVKAAFYGKSKLYCSVACQNGIKKQQVQQQGTKRTIESLNYSNSSSSNNSPINVNSSSVIINPVTTTQQVITHLSNPVITASLTAQVFPIVAESTLNVPENQTINTLPLSSAFQLSNTNQQTLAQVQQISNEQQSHVFLTTEIVTNTATSPNQHVNGNASKRARNNSSSTLSSITNFSTSYNSQYIPPENVKNETEDMKSPQTKTTKFKWTTLLDLNMKAAPVHFFKNIPLKDFWKKFESNIIVEVPNTDFDGTDETRYWFAQVKRCEGYLIKLRFIGYEEESKYDFWMHSCDAKLHPIGWASENNIILTPPKNILELQEEWREYLLEKMVGFRTLPKDFHQKITKSRETRFKKGMLLEMLDRNKVSFMRIARVIDNIGGRLQLRYENVENSDDFWCNELSDLIHPIGWSSYVGHQINATEDYKKRSLTKYERNQYEPNECSPDMFKNPNEIINEFSNKKLKPFKQHMKLEAVDPLNLSKICVATVVKVLKDNYLMVRIDGFKQADDSDLFCYHQTSSSLFPAGFCQRNSLNIHYFGYVKKNFSWKKYLNETTSEFAPNELFNIDPNLQNPFKVGMKLESVEIIEPNLICVATVVAVVNRLLRISFDGWDDDYDQWIDFESENIYPVGWCELVGYPLAPPNRSKEDNRPQKAKKKTNI